MFWYSPSSWSIIKQNILNKNSVYVLDKINRKPQPGGLKRFFFIYANSVQIEEYMLQEYAAEAEMESDHI